MRVLLIILFVSFGAYSQQPKGKIVRFTLGYGLSHSKAKVFNDYWLNDADKSSKKWGYNIYAEGNIRLYKGFWLGLGFNWYDRKFEYIQVNPFEPSIKPTRILNNFMGPEYNFKAEYLYFFNQKTFISGLFRAKWMWESTQKKTFFSSGGLPSTYTYHPYLAAHPRIRFEIGTSVGQTFGNREQFIFSLEPTYSFYAKSGKKVESIDKLNINTFNLNFMLTWYPKLWKEK